MSRQSLFALHAAVRRHTDPGPAWTLIELLRSANGHQPLGPPLTPQDVFELHASMDQVLGPSSAWTLMETLRERNLDRLPTGEPWPDAFAKGRATSHGRRGTTRRPLIDPTTAAGRATGRRPS